ncbi:undecaprenyl-diphosphate phosphatase [Liberiplasma polymorphum]|uniref:undecaprenyl-diphosphate phosphatase n=1 Tax=Liberiplasma polymorphum TaxID=3374570 RepID=UPI003771435F
MQNFIELLKYIIIGSVQGITEPLPISSSGHLVIIQTFLDMPTVDYFLEIVLHFASLIAILILFRVKILALIKGNIAYVFKRDETYKHDFHYFLLILIGVIPAGLAGLLFKSFFEGFLTLLAVGISLLFTGSFLLMVQKQSIENTKETLSWHDALTIGLFQVFALLPGISRSGSTFIGGLFKRVKFEKVVEFSFMMYIPISIGTMVLELFEVETFSRYNGLDISLAFITSGLFTYFAFKWFINAVKQGNLKYFGYYCLAVGLMSIGLYYLM